MKRGPGCCRIDPASKTRDSHQKVAVSFNHGTELRQVERPYEEDGHLVTGDGRGGAVVAVTASAGDALVGELLDPGCSPM